MTNFLEVYRLIAEFPDAFTIRTKKGLDLWSLPEKGTRNAYVHISRFPKLIKFIKKHENEASHLHIPPLLRQTKRYFSFSQSYAQRNNLTHHNRPGEPKK